MLNKEELLTIIKSKIVVNEKGCWIWQGPKVFGYGYLTIGHSPIHRRVHRLTAWIARGFNIDDPKIMVLHKPFCNDKLCCNPEHTYEGNQVKNMLDRKSLGNYKKPTHCKHGHEFNEKNTYTDRRGKRHCRPCKARTQRISNRLKIW